MQIYFQYVYKHDSLILGQEYEIVDPCYLILPMCRWAFTHCCVLPVPPAKERCWISQLRQESIVFSVRCDYYLIHQCKAYSLKLFSAILRKQLIPLQFGFFLPLTPTYPNCCKLQVSHQARTRPVTGNQCNVSRYTDTGASFSDWLCLLCLIFISVGPVYFLHRTLAQSYFPPHHRMWFGP